MSTATFDQDQLASVERTPVYENDSTTLPNEALLSAPTGRPHAAWNPATSAISVTGKGKQPDYLSPLVARFSALLGLPENWDSYSARRTRREAVIQALNVLFAVMEDTTPLPSVIPTSSGGIDVEWHVRGVELEISFDAEANVGARFLDLRSERSSWERETLTDFHPIASSVSLLTRRR